MMANEGEEPVEYESDPEEAIHSLTMRRRREASDDEEGGEQGRESERIATAEELDEDDVLEDEEEEEEEEEEYLGEDIIIEEGNSKFHEQRGSEGEEEFDRGKPLAEDSTAVVAESTVEGTRLSEEASAGARGMNQGDEEEDAKKENEPYAVPTAGAFYMHDDRFQENGHSRHRRTSGARKLWESKDNRAWVHDRFEEMNIQDQRHHEERSIKGRFRGGGRYRGFTDHGYGRGNGSRTFNGANFPNRNHKVVSGRGSRRHELPMKTRKGMPPAQEKQSGKVIHAMPNSSSGRVRTNTSSAQPDLLIPQKHVFASSLNSASPPFYPSASSNQGGSLVDTFSSSSNKNLESFVLSENLSTSQSATLVRGKTIAESNGPERSPMDDTCLVGGKSLKNMLLQPIPLKARQFAQSNNAVTGPIVSTQLSFLQSSSVNQVSSSIAQAQISALQQKSAQSSIKPASRGSQQFGQHPVSGSQASFAQAPSTNLSDNGDLDSPPGSSKSKMAIASKEKDGVQGSGKGSLVYAGAQVIGSTGPLTLAHGDQSFSATPALLPVMQFGGQHHGGLGVRAVGMALPGYVAQPQLGFRNSEMTWVPVLAGAAGALGASYCSPYIAVDGGYYTRSSGQSSSTSGSKETRSNKPNNLLKLPQRPELDNEEFGQRHNKPRRYSEMNFGQ